MKKRLLALNLALVLLLTLMPTVALADDTPTSGTCGENLTWTLEDGVLTISGTGYMWPDRCWDIGDFTSIVIERGVTTISSDAFNSCSSVTSVKISDSVTAIYSSAFRGCSALTSITIPASVTEIGQEAFANCSSLSEIYYDGTEEQWAEISIAEGNEWLTQTFSGVVRGVASDSDLQWYYNDGVLNIGGTGNICSNLWNAFDGCTSKIVIEDGITGIGDGAFGSYSELTNIKIPDSVTTIGNSAFNWCSSLTSVEIPNSVTTIGNGTFYCCTNLTSVNIPSNVTTLGNSTFSWCSSLTSVAIPDSVTSIGDDAFSNCEALKSVTIPSGVTTIGDRTFERCHALESVTIPDSVTKIGDYAFSNCGSLTDVNYTGTDEQWDAIDIGEGNDWLFARSFSGTCGGEGNGDNVTWSFDEGVLTVSGCGRMGETQFEVFLDCITEVVIEDGVTTIGDAAFQCCNNLINITIPSSVTAIGSGAFGLCISLTSIDIPDSVISIGNDAFNNCWSLTTLTIPGSVKEMGESLLFGCSDINSVIILDGVEEIAEYAFGLMLGEIHSLTLPGSIKRIGFHAFDSIGTVYFNGTQEQWDSIEIEEDNQALLSAEIIFTGVHTHTTKTVGYVEPTCTEAGYTGDEVCTGCGETVSTGEVIAATGHSYGDDNVCDDCGHKQSVSEAIQTWISDTVQTIRNFFDKIFGRFQ